MKVRVHVTFRNGIHDPEGRAIHRALETLGFSGVRDARQGKVIDLELDEADAERARREVDEMCRRLLANPVIEDYTIDLG